MRPYTAIMAGALIWLSAAAPGRAEAPKMCGSPLPATPQKENAMFLDDLKTVTDAIPPIDRAMPVQFKTAAFGLG